jgi:hypothetical protein
MSTVLSRDSFDDALEVLISGLERIFCPSVPTPLAQPPSR